MRCAHTFEDGSMCKRSVKDDRCWQHKRTKVDDVLDTIDAVLIETAPKPFMRQFKAAGTTP